jgi:hypothetical protein
MWSYTYIPIRIYFMMLNYRSNNFTVTHSCFWITQLNFINLYYLLKIGVKCVVLTGNVTPITVDVRSKAGAFGRSLTRIVGSNPTGDMDVCLLWVLCVVR